MIPTALDELHSIGRHFLPSPVLLITFLFPSPCRLLSSHRLGPPLSLHLIQLQLGVDAFAFGLLLLGECFLCLSARFEELRAQILYEHEGVVE